MICLDANGVIFKKSKKQYLLVKNYLLNSGYPENVVDNALKILKPYDYGNVFTTNIWYATFYDELKYLFDIYQKIAKVVDCNNDSLALELFMFTQVFNERYATEETIDLIQKMAKLDDLVLLSDAHYSMKCLLKKLGIYQLFREIVISADYGSKKSKQIYEYISKKYNEPIYFFDDTLSNVELAKSVGFRAYWVDKNHQGDFADLGEIYTFLRSVYDIRE